jgi:hypothetical protein
MALRKICTAARGPHWPVPVRELWENATLVKEINPLQHGFQPKLPLITSGALFQLRTYLLEPKSIECLP